MKNNIYPRNFVIILAGLVGVFILLALPLLSSQLIFEQNELIDLKLPCSFNGSFCNSSAECNVTIDYPNGSILADNTPLTNTGNGKPNYTITDSSVIGIHQGFYYCFQSGFYDDDTFEFEITPTGSKLGIAESIVYIVFVFALIFTFVLFLYGAIIIPYKPPRDDDGRIVDISDVRYFKVICMVFSYLLLMAIFGIMRQITANYLYLNQAHKTFQWLFWFMLSFTYPIIVVSLILLLVTFVHSRKVKRALERGVPVR